MSAILERRRRRPEINIVPLVDVLIVLIFFFLVSMQFRDDRMLNITVPEAETAGDNTFQQQIELGIDGEGKFYYNGEEMTREEVASAIRTAATLDRDLPVILVGDEEAAHRDVVYLMDVCRKAGFDDVVIQVR